MSGGDPRKLPKNHPVRSRKLPWYTEFTGDKLTPQARQLFKEYSGIPLDELEPHVIQVRDMAWDICPWPCTGEFWFVSFSLRRHLNYAKLISFLQSSTESADDSKPPPTFLDLGTCLGQDVHALHYDGVPIDRLFGSDILAGFEGVGHALFKDGDRFTSEHFFQAISLTRTQNLHHLRSHTAPAVTSGAWFFRHRRADGHTERWGAVVPPPLVDSGVHKVIYRHNRETMIDMWKGVGEKLGIELNVWADYDLDEMRERQARAAQDQDWEKKNRFFSGDEERRIFFLVERI